LSQVKLLAKFVLLLLLCSLVCILVTEQKRKQLDAL